MGRLHPKISLQTLRKMGMFPLRWEAKRRCIEFWHRVMNMGEERLGKRSAKAVCTKGACGKGI